MASHHPDEDEEYDEEDPSLSKRQKTNNEYSETVNIAKQPVQLIRENKLEWKDNLYSSFSVFGAQNHKHIRHQQILKGNFHARIMHIMSEKLEFNMPLDMHFLRLF
jgi:hypothetical protein